MSPWCYSRRVVGKLRWQDGGAVGWGKGPWGTAEAWRFLGALASADDRPVGHLGAVRRGILGYS